MPRVDAHAHATRMPPVVTATRTAVRVGEHAHGDTPLAQRIGTPKFVVTESGHVAAGLRLWDMFLHDGVLFCTERSWFPRDGNRGNQVFVLDPRSTGCNNRQMTPLFYAQNNSDYVARGVLCAGAHCYLVLIETNTGSLWYARVDMITVAPHVEMKTRLRMLYPTDDSDGDDDCIGALAVSGSTIWYTHAIGNTLDEETRGGIWRVNVDVDMDGNITHCVTDTVCGDRDGAIAKARVSNQVSHIVVARDDTLFFADLGNRAIRRATCSVVERVASDVLATWIAVNDAATLLVAALCNLMGGVRLYDLPRRLVVNVVFEAGVASPLSLVKRIVPMRRAAPSGGFAFDGRRHILYFPVVTGANSSDFCTLMSVAITPSPRRYVAPLYALWKLTQTARAHALPTRGGTTFAAQQRHLLTRLFAGSAPLPEGVMDAVMRLLYG